MIILFSKGVNPANSHFRRKIENIPLKRNIFQNAYRIRVVNYMMCPRMQQSELTPQNGGFSDLFDLSTQVEYFHMDDINSDGGLLPLIGNAIPHKLVTRSRWFVLHQQSHRPAVAVENAYGNSITRFSEIADNAELVIVAIIIG